MSNMDHYTKFIAEQARKSGTALSEATEHWTFDPDSEKTKKHPSLEAAKKHAEKLNDNEDREQEVAVHEVKPHANGKEGTIVKTHANPGPGEWHTHTDDKGDTLKL